MESKHTPGPWEVKKIAGQLFVAATPDEGHPYFRRYTTIGILEDDDYPTKVADARLIAAAPDLLEALKQVSNLVRTARKYFPKSVKHSDRFQLEQTCATITSAIAKAEKG